MALPLAGLKNAEIFFLSEFAFQAHRPLRDLSMLNNDNAAAIRYPRHQPSGIIEIIQLSSLKQVARRPRRDVEGEQKLHGM
jgi:hypothetical protein